MNVFMFFGLVFAMWGSGLTNAKVSDGWPSSNARIGKQRGGPAIRSAVWCTPSMGIN